MQSTFNPAEYGLTAEGSAENLVKAFKAYESVVKILKADQSTEKSSVSITLTLEENISGLDFIAQLRMEVFAILEDMPNLSAGIFDALGTLKSDVKDFRDWHVSNLNRAGKSVTVKSGSPEADKLRDDAEELQKFVNSLFNVNRMMAESGLVTTPSKEDLPTKTLESGAVVPNMSRLPKRASDNGTSVGRKPQGSTLQFVWSEWQADSDGIIKDHVIVIPAGTSLGDVVYRYVCSASFRTTPKEVFDMLPRETKPDGTKGHLNMIKGQAYELKFPTGYLYVTLPGDVQEETETEESETPESETEESE